MNRLIPTPTSKFRQLRRRLTKRKANNQEGDEHPLQILWRYQILAPDSDIVAYWNKVFLITCLIALFIDPLYFYLPYVGGPGCLSTDISLAILITFFRTVTDLFYLLHMIMKFRTAFISPTSKVFGRGELVMDPHEIAVRYLKSDFLIDLAATLPIPQIVIWLVIPATRNSRADHANSTLALFVLIQYVPRLFLIFPLNQRINKTTGVIAKTAWAGAAYNLILFMLASHIVGATWYLLSIGRQFSCWKMECNKESVVHFMTCLSSFLDCNSLNKPEREKWMNSTRVVYNCDAKNEQKIQFKFGMYGEAFTNDVASSSFIVKYLYCFWWGLRNLSSYAQEIETSKYMGETVFAILLALVGLILFADLIGNVQNYLQSMTVRLEEWRVKRRDTEEWMRHRQLPPDLQERVRRFVQYQWVATRGVNEDAILKSLPLDLRREIQRHLCLSLVRRVPFFSQMDDQLLDAICERLVSSLSILGTYIFQEGDPVDEMLFIIRGRLESSTTNGGRSGFFNSITLGPGDFCGEELLTWALMQSSSLNLPSSTRTVKTVTEVEAFALGAEDLKFFASQFKRLHSKKIQHAFRYYSHQWRAWSTCFIQAAWRRYKRRKMAMDLTRQEILYYSQFSGQEDYDLDDQGGENYENESVTIGDNVGSSLGTTILVSKFAANTRKGVVQRSKVVAPASTGFEMPKLFKPEEPDFSSADV